MENGWAKGWISRCCPHHVDSAAFVIGATSRSQSQVLCSSLLNARRRSRQRPDRWNPKSCGMHSNREATERGWLLGQTGFDGLWGWFTRQLERKGDPLLAGEVNNVTGCELIGCFLALLVVKDGEQRFLLKRWFREIIELLGFTLFRGDSGVGSSARPARETGMSWVLLGRDSAIWFGVGRALRVMGPGSS